MFKSLLVRLCVLGVLVAACTVGSHFIGYLKDSPGRPMNDDPRSSAGTPLSYWDSVPKADFDRIERPENDPAPRAAVVTGSRQ